MVLVYDVTNMESFENISKWHKKIEKDNKGDPLPGMHNLMKSGYCS